MVVKNGEESGVLEAKNGKSLHNSIANSVLRPILNGACASGESGAGAASVCSGGCVP